MGRKTTVAMVHGRDHFDDFEPLYLAATALDIQLIVLDVQGHWLQGVKPGTFADVTFLPFDMTIDEDLPQRIAKALHECNISGIVTVSDRYLYPVAMAAERLGLFTNPVDSYRKTSNKLEIRRLDDVYGQLAVTVSSMDEFNTVNEKLEYPVIAKPLFGWSSQHVYKAVDATQLGVACQQILEHGYSGKALIEPFVDGPEVDANFFLCRGELLWCEIKDEIPRSGEFLENITCLPSVLSEIEQRCVRETGLKLIRQLGFHTGVFQIEARVQKPPLLLKGVNDNPNPEPRCFIIEINARPGSFRTGQATLISAGVDWFQVWLCAAIGDVGRMRELTQPALQEASTVLVWLRAARGGKILASDPCGDYMRANSDLQAHVRMFRCFYRKGDEVPAPRMDAPINIGYMIIVHPQRDIALAMGQRVQDSFGAELEQDSFEA